MKDKELGVGGKGFEDDDEEEDGEMDEYEEDQLQAMMRARFARQP